jgi:hypothetical protein
MDPNPSKSEIIGVDRIGQGILVEFSNGQGWVYSGELLYSIRSQAQKVTDTNNFENTT